MELRQMSTAFLFNGNKVLMIRKDSSRISDTAFWSGLGGHIEPDELNFPKRACLREIYEESGILEEEIEELRLRYILLRIKDDEIRQQFVYIGYTKKTRFINSDEGELQWIDTEKVLKLQLSKIVSFMLEHFFENPSIDKITIGTMTILNEQKPAIQWSVLKDPMIF